MTLKIAIVGRPNVGKSTLFNRLAGRRLAIVHDQPGVTRDRREGATQINDLPVTLIDTAGLDDAPNGSIESRMSGQTEAAIREADICLFMIDARVGVTPLDELLADRVRRSGRPVVLVANKCESNAATAGLYDSFSLGFGDPAAVSAEHGLGIGDLYDVIERLAVSLADAAADSDRLEDGGDGPGVADTEAEPGPDRPLRMAVVGRPNTGKSTLINWLVGSERMLTGPEAGLTRDAVSVDWMWGDMPVRLFDTAGMRKRARVSGALEKLSIGDTLRAIRFAEIVVLMVDATQPFEKQDLQIADLVEREGRGIVIAVNKWDLIKDKAATRKVLEREIERLLPQISGVPMVMLSAKTGRGIKGLMPAAMALYKRWNTRVSTGPLNRWLQEALVRHSPPAPSGRRLRLRYLTQAKARPPTFILFCSRPKELPQSYLRYLIKGLRETFAIAGTPVRLQMRKGDNPYVKK